MNTKNQSDALLRKNLKIWKYPFCWFLCRSNKNRCSLANDYRGCQHNYL